MPKTNISYWSAKLKRNVQKQKEDIEALKKAGWRVFIIWECQTKNGNRLTSMIQKFLT